MPTLAAPDRPAADKLAFDLFGYTVLRGLFTPAEVARYGRALDRAADRRRGGPFAGPRAEKVAPLVAEDPETFAPLLDDPRLSAAAADLLGGDFLYTGGNDGNVYAGDTPWHVDGGGVGAPRLVKLAFYCEPLGDGGGCLSVLPGSHHEDYFRALSGAFFADRTLDARSPAVPGRVPLPTGPGDVIAFDHRLWHASFGGRPGRRQFAFSFAAAPRHSWEQLWLRGYVGWTEDKHGRPLVTAELADAVGASMRSRLERLGQVRGTDRSH